MNRYKEFIAVTREHYEFFSRARFSVMMLLILTIGLNLMIPGITLMDHTASAASANHFLTAITGGTTARPVLFSLGISPFMMGGVLFSVIEMSDNTIVSLMSEKEKGVLKNILTFGIALIQGHTRISQFRLEMANNPSEQEAWIMVLMLATGSMIVSWLANLNLLFGLGGTTLMILPGMVSTFPSMIAGKAPVFLENPFLFVLLILMTFAILVMTLFFFLTEYRIRVQRISLDEKFNNSYLAFKLLNAGSFPLMIAMTLFDLPVTLFPHTPLITDNLFSMDTPMGAIMYGLILYFISLLFSFVFVRPKNIAKGLRNSGDYVLNIAPGEDTEKHIHKIVLTLATLGSVYLTVLVVVPLFIGNLIGNATVSGLSQYFGFVFTFVLIIDRLIDDAEFIYWKFSYDLFGKKVTA